MIEIKATVGLLKLPKYTRIGCRFNEREKERDISRLQVDLDRLE